MLLSSARVQIDREHLSRHYDAWLETTSFKKYEIHVAFGIIQLGTLLFLFLGADSILALVVVLVGSVDAVVTSRAKGRWVRRMSRIYEHGAALFEFREDGITIQEASATSRAEWSHFDASCATTGGLLLRRKSTSTFLPYESFVPPGSHEEVLRRLGSSAAWASIDG